MWPHLVKKKSFIAILLLLVAGGGYGAYRYFSGGEDVVRYVTGRATTGTLVVSVSGSGQVSAVHQIDVKPKAGGDVVSVAVANGDAVKAGTVLMRLDARDAEKTIRDAEANLAGARISLEKLKKPADALAILQAENAVVQAKDTQTKLLLTQETKMEEAKEAKQKAEDNLAKAYDDGSNAIASAFLDLPTIVTGLQDILFASTIGGGGQWNIDYYTDAVQAYDLKILQYKSDTSAAYRTARTKYDTNFASYKTTGRFTDTAATEKLILETYETTKSVAEAVKSAMNFIQYYQDRITDRSLRVHPTSTTHIASLTTYTATANKHLSALLTIKRTIDDNKESLRANARGIAEMEKTQPLDRMAAEQSVKEREAYLVDLKAGPDALDIKSQELTVTQRANALRDAREKLADYFVRASFDGIVAKVHVKKGDTVSSATAVATFIAAQSSVEISLNEVDAANVQADQRATLTFDAIPDLTLTGKVIDVDTIGTTTQGVVNYAVTIALDVQDAAVRPGMSASATIATETKTDALLVPNGAIKGSGGISLVEIVPNDMAIKDGVETVLTIPPQSREVTIGLANDTQTEILSGLSEGDRIVVRTVQPATTQNQRQQSSPLFPTGGGGGMGRVQRGR